MVTKLWINGRASEDKDEWTEEVRAHDDKCYDDKMDTSEVQAERMRYHRSRGDSLVTLQGTGRISGPQLDDCELGYQ